MSPAGVADGVIDSAGGIGTADDFAGGVDDLADSTGAADDTTCGAGNTITDINRTIYCTSVSSHHKTLSEVEILTIRPMNRSMNPRTTTHQQVTWLVLAT